MKLEEIEKMNIPWNAPIEVITDNSWRHICYFRWTEVDEDLRALSLIYCSDLSDNNISKANIPIPFEHIKEIKLLGYKK